MSWTPGPQGVKAEQAPNTGLLQTAERRQLSRELTLCDMALAPEVAAAAADTETEAESEPPRPPGADLAADAIAGAAVGAADTVGARGEDVPVGFQAGPTAQPAGAEAVAPAAVAASVEALAKVPAAAPAATVGVGSKSLAGARGGSGGRGKSGGGGGGFLLLDDLSEDSEDEWASGPDEEIFSDKEDEDEDAPPIGAHPNIKIWVPCHQQLTPSLCWK